MNLSFILFFAPTAMFLMLLSHFAQSEVRQSIGDNATPTKLSPDDIIELERALDPNNQTPAEDRHLALKKLIKLGALAAILATPALAAALLPLKLIPLLLILKHKIPPVNVIPLPPPPPPVYYDQPYQPQMPPPVYDAPPPPPVYNAPPPPPVYSAPPPPPVYNAPPPPPAYNTPMGPPPCIIPLCQPGFNTPQGPPMYNSQSSYQSSGYRK